MVVPWYMELPCSKQPDLLSKDLLLKVRRFYMQQLALSEALLEAKPLGICKITTSERNGILEPPLTEAEVLECIQSKSDSKGTLF